MNFTRNTKFQLIFGFAFILVILATLTAIWLSHVNQNSDRIAKLVRDQQASEHIFTMRDAAHNRALILLRMAIQEDPFDREDGFINFSAQAENFILARDKLLELGMTAQEKVAWGITKSLIREGGMTQRNTATLIRDFEINKARTLILDQVIPIQNKVMEHLTIMLELKKQKIAHEISDAALYNRSVYISISVLAGSALAIAAFISFIVIKTTSASEIALLHALEYAQSANQHKSLFLANMSHELRTPLNAIIGYSEMLQEEAIDHNQSDMSSDLEKIHVAGNHLLTVINDILDLSKIEANKSELSPLHFLLRTLIEDIRDTIQPMVTKNNNLLVISDKIDCLELYNDATKIKQILLNLLSNANKFTNNGHVSLTISEMTQDNYPCVKFEVSDDGIGMTKKQMENLFVPFSQADLSTTRKFGGTGLGLTISKHYSEMMNGSISVKSEISVGSTFSIIIPINISTQLGKELVA